MVLVGNPEPAQVEKLPGNLQSVKCGRTNKSCHRPKNFLCCWKMYFCVLEWDPAQTDGRKWPWTRNIQRRQTGWLVFAESAIIAHHLRVCVCANLNVLWLAVGWGERKKTNFLFSHWGNRSEVVCFGLIVFQRFCLKVLFCKDEHSLWPLHPLKVPQSSKASTVTSIILRGRKFGPIGTFTMLNVQPCWT